MAEQVPTATTTVANVMRSRAFGRGVDDFRSKRPPRFDLPDTENWNYERGPSTICLLAEKKTPPEAVKAVLDLAETEPVSHREAMRIVKDVRAETNPPPAPKPPDGPLRDAKAVEAFRDATGSLSKLAAKPAALFIGIVPQHELFEMLANFLMAIAAAGRKAA